MAFRSCRFLKHPYASENGIPVMPFSEASLRFRNLLYFISSEDFKYTIIGDLLEKGVSAEKIINYVPVEKRRGCIYFYSRLLMSLGREGGSHAIDHCCANSFIIQSASTPIPSEGADFSNVGVLLEKAFCAFENNTFPACKNCVLNKEQYLISKSCWKRYQEVCFLQETDADCPMHCVYCCAGGNSATPVKMHSLENYGNFVDSVLALGWINNDFVCTIGMSERDFDSKIALAVEKMNQYELSPLVWRINSCLLVYSKHLAELLQRGQAYIIWSLDAGTREVYRKIKQVDAFDHVVENVRRYIAQDAFGGRFIVAKYLIVKGINDNAAEFDAYLQLVMDLGLQFVSINFDYYAKADANDLAFLQKCYEKIIEAGLQFTYKNHCGQITEALNMNSALSQ